jgi:hypothetical protein
MLGRYNIRQPTDGVEGNLGYLLRRYAFSFRLPIDLK